MCIINLTPSKKIDRIIHIFNIKTPHSQSMFGAFVLSKSIQNIIQINQKYSLITIHVDMRTPKFHLLYTMDQLTVSSIRMALDRFEELLENM